MEKVDDTLRNSHDPINEIDQDSFNRGKFAEGFTNWITKSSYKNLTIGLYGSWGSGKSSVFNLIRKYCLPEKKFILMNFNPWYLGTSPEDMVEKFLNELNKVLAKENWWNFELRENIKEYSKVLSSISVRPPGLIVNFKEIFTSTSKQDELIRLKDLIEKQLTKFNKKIVIFIDDIDSQEIQSVFKLVREICNFSNTIYVLALDEEMVSKL